jgi:hypothetical protein
MPARDIYHAAVIKALTADSWTITNDPLYLAYDGTSEPVAEALLEAGILREDIVLGFHPAELRQYTDFAVS